MDWQFKIGIGLCLVYGFLQFTGIGRMPNWATWPGIGIGILFFVWGVLPNHEKIPIIPAFLFIFFCAGAICCIAWGLSIYTPEIQTAPKQPTAEEIASEVAKKIAAKQPPVKLLPIKITSSANIIDYTDEYIAKIKWNQSYANLRIVIENNTDKDYRNREFDIHTDLTIADAGKLFGPDVNFIPIRPKSHLTTNAWSFKTTDNTGKSTTTTHLPEYDNRATTYRVQCRILPHGGHIELIFALIFMNPPVNDKPPDKLVGDKRMPKWVQIHGNYSANDQKYPIEYQNNF